MEKDSLNEIKYPNCQQNPPTFSRSCDIYKRERDLMEIKYKRNTSFEARKIVESYMKVNIFASVAQREKNNQQQQSTRQLRSSHRETNSIRTKEKHKLNKKNLQQTPI